MRLSSLLSLLPLALALPMVQELPSVGDVMAYTPAEASAVLDTVGYKYYCQTFAGSPELIDALKAIGELSKDSKCAKPANSWSSYTLIGIGSATLSLTGKEGWSLPCVDAALLFALLAILCEKDVDGLIRSGGQLKYAEPDKSLRLAY